LFGTLDLIEQELDEAVVPVKPEGRLGDPLGIVQAPRVGQQERIARNRLRTERAKGKGLTEGEVGFLEHALSLGGRLGIAEPPGVNAADRTAEFGKRLLRLVIADELAVAGEALVIVPFIHAPGKIANLLDRRVVSNPVADQALRILA